MSGCFLNVFQKDVIRLMRSAIGLDISDLSVKMIQLEEKCGCFSVRSFASSPISSGSIIDGEIQQPDAVVFAIQEALKKSCPKKLNTRKVMCSIPETKAFLRIIPMPKMSDEEIKESIVWELEENIPLSLDQVYYDYQILDDFSGVASEQKKNVLVVAAPKKVVDSFLEVLDKCGLETVGMEIESVAQAQCLIPNNSPKKYSLLILDVGDRRSSLLFSVGDVIAFTSSTHISSQMITEAFSRYFNVTQEKAEKMKFEQGIGSPVAEDPFFRAAKPVLDNLCLQIQHSASFVIDTLKVTDHIDMILLCGGGANTKGLPLYFSRKIGIPTVVGDPWTNIPFKKGLPPLSKEIAIQHSTAIGLALQSMYFAYEDIA